MRGRSEMKCQLRKTAFGNVFKYQEEEIKGGW